jgi:hypothetical protein
MGATGLHFSDSELQCHGTNCGPSGTGCRVNACTQELVDVLDWIRQIAGKPVHVHDAYRCVKHNAQTTGAAADSQHSNGRAADISIKGFSAAQLEAIAAAIPGVRGLGRDDARGFIHVDVRPTVTRALWCYHTDTITGKTSWIPYYSPPKPSAINV